MVFLLRWNCANRRKHSQVLRGFFTLLFASFSIYALGVLLLKSPLDFGMSPGPMRKTPAFVITISGHDGRVPTVVGLFRKYAHLSLRPHYGVHGNQVFSADKASNLTPGERGLRETMKGFFKLARLHNYKEVFLFEDDAIPHLRFSQLFDKLSHRCRQADVLLLGATVWHKARETWPKGPCFNADNRTYGAFALLIKRSAFFPILNWLERGPPAPFDHMYRYLQHRGLTVRVAHPPFLVIPDVSHRSLVNNNRSAIQFDMLTRAERHDWHLEDYPLSLMQMNVNRK